MSDMLFRLDDPRLGKIIKHRADISGTKSKDDISIGFIGFPNDEGVRRNLGRIGSAQGPGVIRELLPKLGCLINREFNVDLSGYLILI
ncbi:unnamed protein product [Protopolystoma xenopodis]|uniref:Uncharacterized protein n=1 Tax=Protopolystoma xenopodis TaxID=117903 RepID=A0A3S5C1S8_9PLAT|nr:unnamed protein product [Protopolystoma xenopodis]